MTMRLLILPALAFAAIAAGPAAPVRFGNQQITQADIIDARALPELDGSTTILITFAADAARRVAAATAEAAPVTVTVNGAAVLSFTPATPMTETVLYVPVSMSLEEATQAAKHISGKDPLPDDLQG